MADLFNLKGESVGTVELPAEWFDGTVNVGVMHEVVTAQLAAARQGTHSTKTRGQVAGGGAKPWRQKGTGRARAGSTRAPQWTGGGVVFGPSPRSYGGKVNRKVRQQAFRASLRAHADRGTLGLIEPVAWEAPSTKRAVEYLRQAPDGIAARPLLMVVEDIQSVAARSFRNIAGVYILAAGELQVVDVVAAGALLVERSAWERIVGEIDVQAVTPSPKPAPARTTPAPAPAAAGKADESTEEAAQ